MKTADFEVRPIGEGILLSSSALQTITGLNTAINTATNTNTATAPSSTSSSSASSASPSSSTSTTAVDSAVLYSAGYVLQLSGTGAYDSMWIPVGEEEDDPSFSGERADPPSTVVVQGQSGSTRGSMDSRDVTIDKIRNKRMVVSTDNNEEYVPIDSIAVDARNKLSVQTVRAIASRRFEVASIGAGALIASHGCRESRTAVCWLLQLQR